MSFEYLGLKRLIFDGTVWRMKAGFVQRPNLIAKCKRILPKSRNSGFQ